jgi:phage shock protein A
MALLERVATLLRANLNEIVDRAEDPVTMMNQVLLDMQYQLLQVKTQVAIAIADHHLLERKRDENVARESDWMRKAEMALQKHDEELARIALQRSVASRDMAKNFEEQLGDQRVQVENLKGALHNLDVKLAETRAQSELLAAQNRRARTANRAADLHAGSKNGVAQAKEKVDRELAIGRERTELLASDGVEARFAKLEKQDEIERLLAELKSKHSNGNA